jgi:hypothetical protein
MESGDEQEIRGAAVARASGSDPWADSDAARVRQLREDAARPLAVNLAEGLALSEFLSTFTGSARGN